MKAPQVNLILQHIYQQQGEQSNNTTNKNSDYQRDVIVFQFTRPISV
jgi:hypothetical protein